MARVNGSCDVVFKGVKDLLQHYIDSGEELGASLVVNINGKNVVDIWGGYADANQTRPWEENTIANAWSTAKTISSFAALLLIDRGILSPTEKVATYWPEFAANGKSNIEVRHILSHTSGISGWEKDMTWEDIYNVPASTALLAQQKPFWPPGTASGYHAITFGHLIGALVHSTTGKSLKDFIAEEIAAPMGADFQLGAAEMDWPRIAEIIPPPAMAAPPLEPGTITERTMKNPIIDARIGNTEGWKRADIGASNGHCNARSVARILSAISCGGKLDRKQWLSPDTIDLIFQEQSRGKDLVVGDTLCFGIGYGLNARGMYTDWLPEGKICFWGGWGGSLVLMDVERRVTVAYVMNKMENVGIGNDRTKAYVQAIYKALDDL